MSLAQCEMTDYDCNTVTQMPKYNHAENSPGMEHNGSTFSESEGKNSKRTPL